jgi:phospholipase/carboxylesterase
VSALDALPHLIRPAAGEPAGALVLFHGRGTSEHDLFPLLDALDPDRRLLGATPRGPLILPQSNRGAGGAGTAPSGAAESAPWGAHWYIVREIGYPDRDTFSAAYEAASGWLDALAEETGLPPERTAIGGFSQGAVMSWALGLSRGRPRPAGIVALSGFVPTVEGFELDLSPPLPPVAIGHGTYDPVISVEWGRQAKALLESAGAEVLYRESPMPHSVDPSFVAELQAWIAAVRDQASSSASAGATASRAGLPGSSTTRMP